MSFLQEGTTIPESGWTWCMSFAGPTVIRGPWNFKPSSGICPFPRNFDTAVEFHRILQKLKKS